MKGTPINMALINNKKNSASLFPRKYTIIDGEGRCLHQRRLASYIFEALGYSIFLVPFHGKAFLFNLQETCLQKLLYVVSWKKLPRITASKLVTYIIIYFGLTILLIFSLKKKNIYIYIYITNFEWNKTVKIRDTI